MPGLLISNKTVSPISQEGFDTVLVLLGDCTLGTENINQIECLVASYPVLVMGDSQNRTSKAFTFGSQLF